MVTVADVEREVRLLAKESPNNVYESVSGNGCLYTRGRCSNGSQGCIVGQALCRLGFETHCAEQDTFDVADVSTLLECLGISGDPTWLQSVQEWQDAGFPWHRAIARADDFLQESTT